MLIPGRPQTKRELYVGRAYQTHVETLARRHFGGGQPRFEEGKVAITLELYYPVSEADFELAVTRPASWHLHSVPRGNNAPEIILTALSGYLYTHASQVDPLTVSRQLMTPQMLCERFGRECSSGAAVVSWDG